MKIALYHGPAKHQSAHAIAMQAGLARHGIEVTSYRSNPPPSDVAIVWGWRQGLMAKATCRNVLVMERGYIGDRFKWTSLGWNGLNGRARFNRAFDSGERFASNFEHLMRDWSNTGEYALIVGQVLGDMSLKSVKINDWYQSMHDQLVALGYNVKFRSHPVADERGDIPALPNCRIGGSLEDAINGAQFVVTYNSNTGVESVLAGKPTYTHDIGAMAYQVTSHKLGTHYLPIRDEWASALAWKQWTMDEISSGVAWECAHTALTEKAEPKVALVLGGSNTVWKEATDAYNSYKIDAVFAINNCIGDYPGKVDYGITLHPEKLKPWLDNRATRMYPPLTKMISHKAAPGVTDIMGYLWPGMKYSGSSGLYAVKAAMELGYNKIILAGVPMQASAAHYHDDKSWTDCKLFLAGWKAAFPLIKDSARSYSGWTAELLGTPNESWING